MKKTMCRSIDLIEHVPFFMKEVQEFKQIVKTENPEFDLLQDVSIDMMNNQFIKDSTEYGVERWEKILGILPNKDDTLEDRKQAILTMINAHVPYTIRTLKQTLAMICGENNFTVNYNNEKFLLEIEIFELQDSKLRILLELLKEIMPANLVVNVSIITELLTENRESIMTEEGETILADSIQRICF